MQRQNTHLITLLLNEPINYERLLDISTDELQLLKDECDIVMKEIKNDIIKEYEMIKPSLHRMRDWKIQLRKLKEKRELYKTFLSLDKNESLISTSSINSTDTKPISFTDLFRDIENDKLLEDPPSPPISIIKKLQPNIKPAVKKPVALTKTPLSVKKPIKK